MQSTQAENRSSHFFQQKQKGRKNWKWYLCGVAAPRRAAFSPPA